MMLLSALYKHYFSSEAGCFMFDFYASIALNNETRQTLRWDDVNIYVC